MHKFTIITTILTVIVVIALAEVLVSEYLPDLKKEAGAKIGNTSVLNISGEDIGNTVKSVAENASKNLLGGDLNVETIRNSSLFESISNTNSANSTNSTSTNVVNPDFEAPVVKPLKSNVFLSVNHLSSSGFVDPVISPENSEGFLFQRVFLSDLGGVELQKFAIKSGSNTVAKIYTIKVYASTDVSSVYSSIKQRSSAVQGINVNETNQFGQASFYLNDAEKTDTAFLVCRIGDLIYGFSYPKMYHKAIMNLITVLDFEF